MYEAQIESFEDYQDNQDDFIVEDIDTITRRVLDVQREIRNMTTFYKPNSGETTGIAMLARVFNPTKLTYISTIHDSNPYPKNYVEAKNSEDWQKWWKAMSTQFTFSRIENQEGKTTDTPRTCQTRKIKNK
jgi:hypothetical protein